MDVGFIGLGLMGRAMARNLAKAGHRVRGWNRSKVESLEGVEIVDSVADAFDAEATLTMLSDDAAIRKVVLAPGVLSAARPGLVHMVCSTISIACAEELTAAHREAGVDYVAAPVFGRPDAAEAAKLNVLAAGYPKAVEKATPLLQAIGQRVWPMGEDPKAANAAKIAGNMMLGMAVGAMAEGAALARANGLDPKAFFDLMLGTLFAGAPVYGIYAPKILSGDFEPGFKLRLALKDIGLAMAANDHPHHLKLLHAIKSEMEAALEAGLGEKDLSAVSAWVAGSSALAG
ncbi:MAG TPA: NAD(P)-dependent oxidoreductase [Caulobacteraceae bacterium]|jgi:3-hydroxyisobutyrate dehydrogenase-like beta-hydroxyacid dehydrogenase|nr:NAD(P)-dependent oxidoreductase [Caulobacteraceae bacterium]